MAAESLEEPVLRYRRPWTVQPWIRPADAERYVSDSMIRRANLTPDQVVAVEETALRLEYAQVQAVIMFCTRRISVILTPGRSDEELHRLQYERKRLLFRHYVLNTLGDATQEIEHYEARKAWLEHTIALLKTSLEELRQGKRQPSSMRRGFNWIDKHAGITREQLVIIEEELQALEIPQYLQEIADIDERLVRLKIHGDMKMEIEMVKKERYNLAAEILLLRLPGGIQKRFARYIETRKRYERRRDELRMILHITPHPRGMTHAVSP